MALDDTTVDIVAGPVPGDKCSLVLYVIDSVAHSDEERRFELLCAKLKVYVLYSTSAQFREQYPDIAPNSLLIRVLTTTPATEEMRRIIEVGPKNCDWRIPVQFGDYQSFLKKL